MRCCDPLVLGFQLYQHRYLALYRIDLQKKRGISARGGRQATGDRPWGERLIMGIGGLRVYSWGTHSFLLTQYPDSTSTWSQWPGTQ